MKATNETLRTMLRSDDDADTAFDPVDDSLSTGALFDALAAAERRLVLRFLSDCEFMVPLADLAAGAVARDANEDPAEVVDGRTVERTKVQLHHVHVPALADAGLVDYDTRSKMVALTAAGERVSRRLPVGDE